METSKKSTKQKREELKRQALTRVLDEGKELEHFWEALLISNIDSVIDSIEWQDPDTGSVVSAIRWAAKSTDRLSRRILWLNVILVILGGLGLLIAGYELLFK
jgi:hypothetical protein